MYSSSYLFASYSPLIWFTTNLELLNIMILDACTWWANLSLVITASYSALTIGCFDLEAERMLRHFSIWSIENDPNATIMFAKGSIYVDKPCIWSLGSSFRFISLICMSSCLVVHLFWSIFFFVHSTKKSNDNWAFISCRGKYLLSNLVDSIPNFAHVQTFWC